MKKQYDPRIHHRRSIRLKGHNYAGGGTYFITVCAHRNAGDIFAPAPVAEMVGRIWAGMVIHPPPSAPPTPTPVGAPLVGALSVCQAEGTHEECPYSVMPDHFHGIVRMRAGKKALGDFVGAFKSLVVNEYIAGVRAGRFAPFPGKIWHRNYYERIIRTARELANVQNYIRMNPWKNIVHLGDDLRGIGNPRLLHLSKIGMLCSRNCPATVLAAAQDRALELDQSHCVLSGFHSPPEQAILAALLRGKAKIVCCPAWGIDRMKIPADWLPALEQNRMLILEMQNDTGDLAAARERNTFVLEQADQHWLPHVSPGGMLSRLTADPAVSKLPHF